MRAGPAEDKSSSFFNSISYGQSLVHGRLVIPLLKLLRGHLSDHGLRTTPSAGGRGLLGEMQGPLPPASEREARMDDPRIRCEREAGYETCFQDSRSQAGAPFFCPSRFFL